MRNNDCFWDALSRPFFALAPMADVTDVAFRSLFAKYGKPDVFWTEFVSADGLCSPGREVLRQDLLFEEDQRPIVAQLFTSHPEHMRVAGQYVARLGFDGLDINMGCPDRSIERQGCGAGMIRDPENALAVISAAKQSGLPVSVKTRIGYNQDEIDTWIPVLLQSGIVALSVHLRTRKEMSSVPAHWERMPRIISFRDRLSPKTLVIGNGDVSSLSEGRDLARKSGCDGVMIGRGIFGNPWFFNDSISVSSLSVRERLETLVEHAHLFEEKLPGKSFSVMKKHFKAYVAGFVGARELRADLMDRGDDAASVALIVRSFLR